MDLINLIGAETVQSAGHAMQHAADQMKRAANTIAQENEVSRRKAIVSNKCGVFQCPTCNESDPHCEHLVNLAVADCAQCDAVAAERTAEMREALVSFYEDRAAMYRGIMEDFELMGRTVQYLGDAWVALEYANKITVKA